MIMLLNGPAKGNAFGSENLSLGVVLRCPLLDVRQALISLGRLRRDGSGRSSLSVPNSPHLAYRQPSHVPCKAGMLLVLSGITLT